MSMTKTRPIDCLSLNRKHYPDVLELINTLAKIQKRKAHDITRRILIEAGEALFYFPEEYKIFIQHIETLKKEKSTIQPASDAG